MLMEALGVIVVVLPKFFEFVNLMFVVVGLVVYWCFVCFTRMWPQLFALALWRVRLSAAGDCAVGRGVRFGLHAGCLRSGARSSSAEFVLDFMLVVCAGVRGVRLEVRRR